MWGRAKHVSSMRWVEVGANEGEPELVHPQRMANKIGGSKYPRPYKEVRDARGILHAKTHQPACRSGTRGAAPRGPTEGGQQQRPRPCGRGPQGGQRRGRPAASLTNIGFSSNRRRGSEQGTASRRADNPPKAMGSLLAVAATYHGGTSTEKSLSGLHVCELLVLKRPRRAAGRGWHSNRWEISKVILPSARCCAMRPETTAAGVWESKCPPLPGPQRHIKGWMCCARPWPTSGGWRWFQGPPRTGKDRRMPDRR